MVCAQKQAKKEFETEKRGGGVEKMYFTLELDVIKTLRHIYFPLQKRNGKMGRVQNQAEKEFETEKRGGGVGKMYFPSNQTELKF